MYLINHPFLKTNKQLKYLFRILQKYILCIPALRNVENDVFNVVKYILRHFEVNN